MSSLDQHDRNRAGRAVYRKWAENHTDLGPWERLPDWKRENFRRLADAVVEELSYGKTSARIVRIDRAEQQAG